MAPRGHQWRQCLRSESRYLHSVKLQDYVEQCHWNVRILTIVLNLLHVCSPRRISAHPGAVVDLCQNPDDPTRVGFFRRHSKRVQRAADVPSVVHWIQHTYNNAEQRTQGIRSLLEFRAAKIRERLHTFTRERTRLFRCLNVERRTDLTC